MTDREMEMETNPSVLKLIKGEDHVWVDKGSDAEKLWRKNDFALEDEATTAAERKAANASTHPTADDKKLDSRGVVAETDRSKKDR